MAKYKVVTPKGASFTTAGGGYDLELEALIPVDAEIIEAPADEAGFIAAAKDADAIYVGPSDLSFSYGKEPKLDVEDPEILAIYDKLIAATGKRGIAAGIHCGSAAYAKRAIKMGFKLVTVSNEVGLMVNAARAAIKEARS